MLPSDFSPDTMKAAQQILIYYNELYPAEYNRKLFPEMIEAVQFCISWSFTLEDIREALKRSTTHPFWYDALSQGSLTGFLKPRHIESVRNFQATNDLEHKRQLERWENQDAKRIERYRQKGLDEEGRPLLRMEVQ